MADIYGSSENIKVYVRVRPTLQREQNVGECVTCSRENDKQDFEEPGGATIDSVEIATPSKVFKSKFDAVLPSQTTQAELYSHCAPLVSRVVDGINTTIFAYGQTGSGKTYTMLGNGPPADKLSMNGDNAYEQAIDNGIIPRAIQQILQQTQACGRETTIMATYIEVYNERIHDLLAPYKNDNVKDYLSVKDSKSTLEIREGPSGDVCIPELQRVRLRNFKGVAALLRKGSRNREIRSTVMNERSSRSHTILQIIVEQRTLSTNNDDSRGKKSGTGTLMRSKLNLVDLAGSERWDTTVATTSPFTGERLTSKMNDGHISEMNAINTSLSALTSVIAALSDNSKNNTMKHVPFRNSKLTYLLQDSLGGNCHTAIIATISPSLMSVEETCSTLKFADRARNIVTHAKPNIIKDDSLLVKRQQQELHRLRKLVRLLTKKGADEVASDRIAELERQNAKLQTLLDTAVYELQIANQKNENFSTQLQHYAVIMRRSKNTEIANTFDSSPSRNKDPCSRNGKKAFELQVEVLNDDNYEGRRENAQAKIAEELLEIESMNLEGDQLNENIKAKNHELNKENADLMYDSDVIRKPWGRSSLGRRSSQCKLVENHTASSIENRHNFERYHSDSTKSSPRSPQMKSSPKAKSQTSSPNRHSKSSSRAKMHPKPSSTWGRSSISMMKSSLSALVDSPEKSFQPNIGSWIYVLGNTASSTHAKKLAAKDVNVYR